MTLASMDGRAIPSDAAIDEHGLPTTDAAAGLRGAQLPFAGHKGTCLALMIELLAASFTGDAFAYEVRDDPATGPTQHGEFILAVDPETCSKAGGRAAFLDRVEVRWPTSAGCAPFAVRAFVLHVPRCFMVERGTG
ncbi:unnamed protein product [Symbiodinium necroappetens]|uniref:Uncharacterized protein n=1 Tax=Symbiodinium necroappetens TaxID=1628268 RepID=A0A813CBG8_9DINO|nr:unnamed protein product [Symbiodinium necroappetens]